MAANLQDQRVDLLSLPNELLSLVFDILAENGTWDRKDVLNLGFTFDRLFQLSEPARDQYYQISTAFDTDSVTHPLNVQATNRASYVENLSVVSGRGSAPDSVSRAPGMPRLLSRLLKLRTLCITTDLREDPDLTRAMVWRNTLQHQLDTTTFSELKDCSLSLEDILWETPPLNITVLLQAPKLAKLSLNRVDLHADLMPEHFTPLRAIRLIDCWVGPESLSAIFGSPRQLETSDLAANGRSMLQLVPASISVELERLQRYISIVANKQPALRTLRVIFSSIPVDIVESFGETLDFTGLKNLKELCFRTFDTSDTALPWIPIMPFDKLPDLERIEFSTAGPIELDKLAMALLADWFTGTGLSKSLRQLDFITREDHQRPFNRDEQQLDVRLLRGIGFFVVLLKVPSLTYTQEGANSRRTLSAVRDVNSEEGAYVLEDVTHSMDEAF